MFTGRFERLHIGHVLSINDDAARKVGASKPASMRSKVGLAASGPAEQGEQFTLADFQ